jgi:hypothetical protein
MDIVDALRQPNPNIAGHRMSLQEEAAAEIERLRARVKDAEKAMEQHWESKSVQDYYKKHPDPVDANIRPCDH